MRVPSTAKFKLLLLGLQLTCSHASVWKKVMQNQALMRADPPLFYKGSGDCSNFYTGPTDRCTLEPPRGKSKMMVKRTFPPLSSSKKGTDTPVVPLGLSLVAIEVSRACQAGTLHVDMYVQAAIRDKYIVKSFIKNSVSGWGAAIVECAEKDIQLITFCRANSPYSLLGLQLLEIANHASSQREFIGGGTGYVLDVYYNAFESLERRVSEALDEHSRPGIKYTLSGYGLAGGIAVLARMLIPRISDQITGRVVGSGFEYLPQLMTFGTPRIGDMDFVQSVERETRARRGRKNQYLRFDICGSSTIGWNQLDNGLFHSGQTVILGTPTDEYYVSRRGGDPSNEWRIAIDNLCLGLQFHWKDAGTSVSFYNRTVLKYSDPNFPGEYSPSSFKHALNMRN